MSAGRGCWGPCWFRGDRDSTASLINLLYCSGNLAETLSGPYFVIDTILWHTKLVIHCLLSEHASIHSCRKPLRPLYKHQESMVISILQKNTALSQADFWSSISHQELRPSLQTQLQCHPWYRQASFLTPRKFLHSQNYGMSGKMSTQFRCWHSFHENHIHAMPWVTICQENNMAESHPINSCPANTIPC